MPGQMVPQGASSGVLGALGVMLPFLLHPLPLQTWMNTSFSGNHSQSLSFSSHPQLKNKSVSAIFSGSTCLLVMVGSCPSLPNAFLIH